LYNLDFCFLLLGHDFSRAISDLKLMGFSPWSVRPD
jgi:hypothetical protein